MWQMPVVLLMGLSTLLKQCWKSKNDLDNRLVSSILAIGVALVTLHSFVRLKFCEELDCAYIRDYLNKNRGNNYNDRLPTFGSQLSSARKAAFGYLFASHHSPIFSIPFFQERMHEMWWFINFCMLWTSLCIAAALYVEKYLRVEKDPFFIYSTNHYIWMWTLTGICLAIVYHTTIHPIRFPKENHDENANNIDNTEQQRDNYISLMETDLDEVMKEAIKASANRRLTYDNLMWSMPSTVFTGLSFLFELSLNQDNLEYEKMKEVGIDDGEDDARIATSIIGIFISFGVLLSFVRLRYFEIFDATYLVTELSIENDPRHKVPFGIVLHNKLQSHMERRLTQDHYFFIGFFRFSSFYLWLYLYVGLICANSSLIISILFYERKDLFTIFRVCCFVAVVSLRMYNIFMVELPQYDDNMIGRRRERIQY